MDWKNQLTKTPNLVLFIVLISVGVGTASALITITLDGNVNITGDADIDGSLNVDGPITGVETLEGLNCTTEQIAKHDGNIWVCVKVTVQNNPITAVDSIGDVGMYTSIAIGTDSNPVVSYFDASNKNLKVLHCGNTSCTSGNTITTVDNSGQVGAASTSIAIGIDGFPVISYYDSSNDALRVLHCGNTSCTSGNNLDIVDDGPNNVGQFSSIAIGADDNPVISYYDDTDDDLKVLHCGNILCTSGNTATTVDITDDVGKYSSIAIGTDGKPVISYYDNDNKELIVLHCGNISCTSGNNALVVDGNGLFGQFSSIAIGIDNLPVISYYDDTNENLKVLHCGNTLCNSGNTATIVDSAIGVGIYTSIAIGTDGNPVISYWDLTNGALKILYCGDVLCTSGNTITTVDSTYLAGSFSSIAIGADGIPVISYHESQTKDLKVALDGAIVIFE